MAFSFPLYLYFEPADYLRIAPIWGVAIIGLVHDSLFRMAVNWLKSDRSSGASRKQELYGRPDLSGCREIALFFLVWA